MAESEEPIRAQQTYEQMLIDGLMLSDKEAAAHGIGEIFEDVIDSVWTSIPTTKKVKLKVPTPKGWTIAILAWQEACETQPPAGTPKHEQKGHPKNRERRLAKKAILIDLLAAMKMLYRQAPAQRMMEVEDDLDME